MFTSALAAAGLAASLLVAPFSGSTAFASSSDVTPGGRITVDVVTVNGSGCPSGTAAVATAPDNTAFTVTYSDYLAQVGVGASGTDMRKNCQLALQVNVPQGFTYAVAKADYRGYAHLEDGASGLERASYYLQGSSATTSGTHNFSGPMDDNWQATDATDVASMVFAPCGTQRILNVNTELRVYRGSSEAGTTSFMTMDSTDGSMSTVYHLSWKQCP